MKLAHYSHTLVSRQVTKTSQEGGGGGGGGGIEDVLVKVDKFIFLADFIVLDMEEDKEIPIILGRPFLATSRAMIDVQRGELKLRVQDEEVKFNVFKVVRHPTESDTCFMIETVEAIVSSQSGLIDPLETSLVQSESEELGEEVEEYMKLMDSFQPNEGNTTNP